jgi:hypothetical protein
MKCEEFLDDLQNKILMNFESLENHWFLLFD